MSAPVAWLSDVEGQWEKLETFARDNPVVSLVGDRIEVADGAIFVFGGDAVDRGPHSRRIVRALVDVADRQPDRVVLLAGNRDLNKIRLPRELAGHPPPKPPPDGLGRPDRLRWILANTMGAREAFELRRLELGGASDEDVVDSFLADVAPDGPHLALLRRARLVHRVGRTLFVHGGVPPESVLNVPNGRALPDVDRWIEALNAWYADELDRFVGDPTGTGHDALVRYQAPRSGLWHNPASVVYGRDGDRLNNPRLPSAEVRAILRRSGIDRVVVGHTPSGDLPSILRGDDDFVLVSADPSRARLPEAPRLLLTDDRTEVRGRVRLDDGRIHEVRFALDVGAHGPIGRRTRDGRLVKAPLGADDLLLFRWQPGYTLEQASARRADLPEDSLRSPEP